MDRSHRSAARSSSSRRLGRRPSVAFADVGSSLTAKAGAVFIVCGADGDIDLDRNPGHGLYLDDMRFLDRAVLRLDGQPLGVLLSQSQGDRLISELANADIQLRSAGPLSKDRISVARERHLSSVAQETISVRSYADRTLDFELSIDLGSGFDDIFTVRGVGSGRRGRLRRPRWSTGKLHLGYDGADGNRRSTEISFRPRPDSHRGTTAVYRIKLRPRSSKVIRLTIGLHDEPKRTARVRRKPTSRSAPFGAVAVETDNELFNRVLARSFADLEMLVMKERGRCFFSAGVPWYVALFGRDSLLTGIETLAYGSDVLADTLRLLASYQGERVDDSRDEQPGKILHELRVGERANLHEPPPSPYYGTVDATPLFLIALGEYVRWTGNLALFGELRQHVDRALLWLDRWGDLDGDGLIDYRAKSKKGFRNQGWKDSDNSVVDSRGALAKPPIALVEVQGYAYRAKLAVASLMRAVGEAGEAVRLEEAASDLKQRVRDAYWNPRRRYLAMAIGSGRQADAIASNPGQALWTGVVHEEHVGAVADRLMSDPVFNGWGIRTLAAGEPAYNPIDYQVGAVWPHDTALIMSGLKRIGRTQDANRLLTGLFTAAATFPLYRLPELFAGYGKDERPVPVRYPVACNPQAWAAGAIPYALTAALGLEPDALAGRLEIKEPALPQWLSDVTVRGLRVGSGTADLRFQRGAGRTHASVLRVEGDLDVRVS